MDIYGKGLRTWTKYLTSQCLTNLSVLLCLDGLKISPLLGYRTLTILQVFLGHIASWPDCLFPCMVIWLYFQPSCTRTSCLKMMPLNPQRQELDGLWHPEDMVVCLCLFGETHWRVTPVQCRLFSPKRASTWWDISVCVTGRMCEVKIPAEGKLRWNNNQWSWAVVADKKKSCTCGFYLQKYMWAKDAGDPKE